MTIIPTELLRTFIALAKLRSYTKTAAALALSQPTISTHMKRLQDLLGGNLFDKRVPGVALTKKGMQVAEYAQKILSLNDDLWRYTAQEAGSDLLKIGIPGDFGATMLPDVMAQLRSQSPELCFEVRCGSSESLLDELRDHDIDLALAFTVGEGALQARHQWMEEMVWVCAPNRQCDASGPVPLVVPTNDTGLAELATTVLEQSGRRTRIAVKAATGTMLMSAVRAGLGITPMPLRGIPEWLSIADDAGLPALPAVSCGIYLRDGTGCEALERAADAIADGLRPREGATLSPELSMTLPAMAALPITGHQTHGISTV